MRVLVVTILASLYPRPKKRPSPRHRISGWALKVLMSQEVPLLASPTIKNIGGRESMRRLSTSRSWVRSRLLSLLSLLTRLSADALGERTLSNNPLNRFQPIAAQIITYGQSGCSGADSTLRGP